MDEPGDAAVLAEPVALVTGAPAAGQDVGLAGFEARADRAATETRGAGLRDAAVGGVPLTPTVPGTGEAGPGLDEGGDL